MAEKFGSEGLGQPEKGNNPGIEKLRESTPQPHLFDVVKIDDRWAQVLSPNGDVMYLDDRSQSIIDWNEYACHPTFGDNTLVRDLLGDGQITKRESVAIRLTSGPENDNLASLRDCVTVCNRVYTKKEAAST